VIILKTQIIVSIITVLVLSVLLYFGGKYIELDVLKPIIPYDDSMFNKIKLIIIPIIIYILIDIICFKKNRKYAFESYISGLLCGLIFYICSYYTYRGIVGEANIYIDYGLYFISLFIIFMFRYKKTTLLDSVSSVVVLMIMLLILVVFSYYPADISIFN
jgi:hypothetical protein